MDQFGSVMMYLGLPGKLVKQCLILLPVIKELPGCKCASIVTCLCVSQNNIIFDILEREETKKKESKHFLLSENVFQALLSMLCMAVLITWNILLFTLFYFREATNEFITCDWSRF